VLVHRQYLGIWTELPGRVGLANAQQFWDHVAITWAATEGRHLEHDERQARGTQVAGLLQDHPLRDHWRWKNRLPIQPQQPPKRHAPTLVALSTFSPSTSPATDLSPPAPQVLAHSRLCAACGADNGRAVPSPARTKRGWDAGYLGIVLGNGHPAGPSVLLIARLAMAMLSFAFVIR
jgi:hypothetical protein